VTATKTWNNPAAQPRESHDIDGEEVDLTDTFSNGLGYPGEDEASGCVCFVTLNIDFSDLLSNQSDDEAPEDADVADLDEDDEDDDSEDDSKTSEEDAGDEDEPAVDDTVGDPQDVPEIMSATESAAASSGRDLTEDIDKVHKVDLVREMVDDSHPKPKPVRKPGSSPR
jgi:hypothetical protein